MMMMVKMMDLFGALDGWWSGEGQKPSRGFPRASGVAFDPGYLTVFESRDFSKPH